MADDRPVPVLRAPRRRLPGRERAVRAGRVARRPGAGRRLRRGRRVADVPRARGARLPAASAPRVRDRHLRAARAHRPRRLAGRRGPLRRRRHAVAHRRARASCTPRCSRCSSDDAPNPLELFQIWLNLPSESKLADPYFSMLWARDTPVVDVPDPDGRTTSVTVVAGELDGRRAPAPPPIRGHPVPTPTSPSGTSRANRARRGRSRPPDRDATVARAVRLRRLRRAWPAPRSTHRLRRWCGPTPTRRSRPGPRVPRR